jgi:molecular chaperone GrpE
LEERLDEEKRSESEILDEQKISDVAEALTALEKAKKSAQINLDGWRRAQADYVNYKRRAEAEMNETAVVSRNAIVLKLIPVLDDLERAILSIPPRLAKEEWIKGIRLIETKFKTILESQGIKQIKAVGKTFDPNLHEAMMHECGKEGTCIRELQRGYKAGELIIRPAQVSVGSGENTDFTDKKVSNNIGIE